MKRSALTNSELSQLCRELAILLHAGVLLGDGLSLLAQEETGAMAELFSSIGREVDRGQALSAALEQSGMFPSYLIGLVAVGERTGRTEQALLALSRYYEHREQTDRQIRAALTYPSVLLLLMLVVIVVLLSRVLPIFDEVYASLGGQLSGIAGGLLTAGKALDAAMPLLAVLLFIAVSLVTVFSVSGAFRAKLLNIWQKKWGDKGISRKLNDARFAQALAMGMSSGLPLEEAVAMCGTLLRDVPSAAGRCADCAAQLQSGGDLADTLREHDMLPPAACRLLTLGLRGGNGDAVMEEISRRLSDEANQALERKVAQVEPTLVLVTSLLVGAILLSVMLPLMNIMTAIG